MRILGYMAKLFAKVCDIGDASKGSLSSYAHVLMMIFYLQVLIRDHQSLLFQDQ